MQGFWEGKTSIIGRAHNDCGEGTKGLWEGYTRIMGIVHKYNCLCEGSKNLWNRFTRTMRILREGITRIYRMAHTKDHGKSKTTSLIFR